MTAAFNEDKAKKPLSMHPQKFALWLFLVTVIMIFASLTSYYIVKKAEGNWHDFDLPNYFWVNTAVIIISSATMHWAYLSAKKDKFQMLKMALLITTILGIAFLIGQYFCWTDLYERGIKLSGNVSGSILFLLSGLHWCHLIGGVIFLIVVFGKSLSFNIHAKNLVALEMCATYWHFLGGLWVYLFVFLLVNR
ncbi:MAG: cytochrome c oxidase subunit 3 [Cytophagaceae bacterium]|nr:cytochrome c oxidase subunit 3 [Cytophagaceae bacterium]